MSAQTFDPDRHLTTLEAVGLGLLMLIAGRVIGWQHEADRPRVAARCRTNGHIELIATGDHVLVRCAP